MFPHHPTEASVLAAMCDHSADVESSCRVTGFVQVAANTEFFGRCFDYFIAIVMVDVGRHMSG